jgi:DNA-binding response OmpR family regulator
MGRIETCNEADGHQPIELDSKPRILVVDEEPEVAHTIRDALVHGGFEAETAENGKQALNFLRARHHFDLLIIDLRPGMDGLELLRQARKLRKNTPAAILTGNATFEDGLLAVEGGALEYVLEYIAKPINLRDLMTVVHRVLMDRY